MPEDEKRIQYAKVFIGLSIGLSVIVILFRILSDLDRIADLLQKYANSALK